MPRFDANGRLLGNYITDQGDGLIYFSSGALSQSNEDLLITSSIATLTQSSGSVTFTSISGSDKFELYVSDQTASFIATPIPSNLITSSVQTPGTEDDPGVDIDSTSALLLPGHFPSATPPDNPTSRTFFFSTGSTLNDSVHNLKVKLETISESGRFFSFNSSSALMAFTSSVSTLSNYGFKSGSTITTFSTFAKVTSSVIIDNGTNDALKIPSVSKSVGFIFDNDDPNHNGLQSFIITGSGISKIYLSSSGKFGIGTANPKNEVDIKADTFKIRSTDGKREVEFSSEGKLKTRKFAGAAGAETTGSEIVLSYSPGTFDTPSRAVVGDIMGTIRWEDESFSSERSAGTPLKIEGEINTSTTDGVVGDINFYVGDPSSPANEPTKTLSIKHTQIDITGSLFTTSHITASGNISASGDLIGDDLILGSNARISTNIGTVTFSSTNVKVVGNITASGNISSSGTIIGSNLSGENSGDQNITNLAVTGSDVIFANITSSGNISASITSTGSFGRVDSNGSVLRPSPNIFDNKIKLIPSDFMANDDGGNTKFGVGYVEEGGASLYGMRVANNATELYAFVSIPQGMTATHVDIFDKNDLAVEVFEAQVNATTMVSKGSGNANTTIDITDVASTATNFLAIEVTTTSATNDKVYGGTVTIAAI